MYIPINNLKDFFEKNKGTIYAGLGCIGVLSSSILSYKAGRKIDHMYEIARMDIEAMEESGVVHNIESSRPTKKNKLKVLMPCIFSNIVTMFFILASDKSHRLSYAALFALYSSLDENYDRLSFSMDTVLDDDQKKNLQKSFMPDVPDDMVSNDPEVQLFYFNYDPVDWPFSGDHTCGGAYFESTVEDVYRFIALVNRQYVFKDRITLNEILDIFKLKRVEFGNSVVFKNRNKNGWIDFIPELITLEDGLECYTLTMRSNYKHSIL